MHVGGGRTKCEHPSSGSPAGWKSAFRQCFSEKTRPAEAGTPNGRFCSSLVTRHPFLGGCGQHARRSFRLTPGPKPVRTAPSDQTPRLLNTPSGGRHPPAAFTLHPSPFTLSSVAAGPRTAPHQKPPGLPWRVGKPGLRCGAPPLGGRKKADRRTIHWSAPETFGGADDDRARSGVIRCGSPVRASPRPPRRGPRSMSGARGWCGGSRRSSPPCPSPGSIPR